jgi:hypothetical protein
MRLESSSPTASVPAAVFRDPKRPETMRIPRSNNAGPSYPTPRQQTPILAQPALAHTQPDVTPAGADTISEKSHSEPPTDLLSRLNKQSEEISALQSQLKRVQTQAANRHWKIQALQLELDVANSGLKQNENDVVQLRTEVQDMKDFINKRSTVTCNLEFLTDNLKERLEQLESQANSGSQRLGQHTPEPIVSPPEVTQTSLETVPAIKMESTVSGTKPVDTPFALSTLITHPTPVESFEGVRRSNSAETTTSIYESIPDEGEVSSEQRAPPSKRPSNAHNGPHGPIQNAPTGEASDVVPSQEACIKELGLIGTKNGYGRTNNLVYFALLIVTTLYLVLTYSSHS